MTNTDLLFNEPSKEQVRLLRSLHQLAVAGREDSPAADALRDQMDVSWEQLTPQQRESVRGLSSDLNGILDGPVPSEKPKEELFRKHFPALVRAKQSRNWHEVLKHLRPLAPYVSPSGLAYVRGRAWSELGDYETALLFFEHANKLEPENGKYAYLALDCLSHVNPKEAVVRAEKILSDDTDHPAAEVIEAASIRWAATNEMPNGLTQLILEELAEVF